MVLLIDIGNTYTKITTDSGEFFTQFSTSSYKDTESLNDKLSSNLDGLEIKDAIISSVVKGRADIFKEYLDSKYNINSLILTHSLKFNIEYPKEEDNELGGDLIAIMEGLSKINKTFIGISLGTATVFTVVKDLKFIGCAIAPGILTSLNGLINSASLIEDTKLSGAYNLLGMDTESSLKSGLWNGFTYLIDGYIKAIREECDMIGANAFLVGGFSDIVIKNLKEKNIYIDKDLIFKGLKEIYRLNRE